MCVMGRENILLVRDGQRGGGERVLKRMSV